MCIYTGCNSDGECQSVPNMESYVCRMVAPSQVSLCIKSCVQPLDCSAGVAPWDEDNYACDDGACRYTGCNSDGECQSVANMEDYLCRVPLLGGVAQCLPSCTTAADCDMGSSAYDTDNYRCENNLCIYTGCNSNAECDESNPSHAMVCRQAPD